MKLHKALVPIVFGILPGMLTAQEAGIPVFLEPVPNSTRVASIDPNQINLIESYPVLDDAKAADGWMFAEYQGTFSGFVDPAAVAKGLRVQNNTPAYLRPDSRSPVLALIQSNDPVEILQVGTDWVEIEFEKLVPVYFQDPNVVGFPETDITPETEAPLPPEEPEEEPIPVEPLMRAGTQQPDPEPEPETLEPIRTPPQIDVSPGLNPERESALVPEGAPASDIPRFIEGKLVRSTRLFGFKPKYEYELKAPGGRRLAWVDLSGTLVSSLAPYIGNQVRIYGEIQSTSQGNPTVVFARTLRLR